MNKTPGRASFDPIIRGGDDDAVKLMTLLAIAWRGWRLVAVCVVLSLLFGGVYVYGIATPLFSASSVVMLESREEQVVDLTSVISGLSGDTLVLNSEVEVLRSRGLMEKVVNHLSLTDDPEFNPALREPGLVRTVKNWSFGGSGGARADEQAQIQSTIDTLLGKLNIQNIRQSLVFRITVESKSPKKAAEIADAIAELYILNQLEFKFDATEQATSWLTERVAQLQGELEAAEGRLADFNAGADLISAETLRALERQAKDLRERIGAARNAVTATADDAAHTRPADERATRQLQALEGSHAALTEQIEAQGSDLITLQQLTREAEASRLLYEYFLSRLKETAVQQGIQQADSRVLSAAVVPRGPSKPRKAMVLGLSGLLGMLVGAAITIFREMRQSAFRTGRELGQITGRPVLGQIPNVPGKDSADPLSYIADNPTSAVAEAVRNLRTTILLSALNKPPQVIVVTSTLRGEGKTTLSLALAQSFVGMGKKVLVVEGDIRRRVFRDYLGIRPRHSLISVLLGQVPLADAVVQDSRVGTDILTADQSQVNAADLFSSAQFAKFVEEARRCYDVILIDTPPVLVVPDARVIGKNADAVLFAVKWNSTSRAQVEEGLSMLSAVNITPAGLILSQVNAGELHRYGYGGKDSAYVGLSSAYYVN
ncbi:polysaccharide biosynthesis tyrosine autokinase [Aliiroseovarius sp. YM-037]|uniref:polysaccharide biosynthesis tyrosine autokinase n=1 Tax=Aliiroseovarius sp. YM-037 TaxID=3341728 RepID=UPI003A80594B